MSGNNNELIMAKIGIAAAIFTLIGDLLALIQAIFEFKEISNPPKAELV